LHLLLHFYNLYIWKQCLHFCNVNGRKMVLSIVTRRNTQSGHLILSVPKVVETVN